MNVIRIVLAGLTLLLAAGCSSSPPVRYYSLHPLDIDHEALDYEAPDDEAPDVEADASAAVVIFLGPLRLPEYVARTQIVTRGEGSEMLFDDYHRWAEPLDDALPRVVAVNVDNLLDDVVVVAFPGGNLLDADYRLQGSIARFDADLAGRAVLIVQWGIGTREGDILVPPRRTRYEAQVPSPGDADAIAAALNDTVALFSRDIAAVIEASLESIPDR